MKNVIIFTSFSIFYACARIPLETRLSAKIAALLGVPTKRGSRTNQAWFTHQPKQYFFEPNLVQGVSSVKNSSVFISLSITLVNFF